MVAGAVGCLALLFCGLFGLVFCFLRVRYRQRLRARREPGFYPTTSDLGNALQNLEVFAQPRIAYVQRLKQTKLAEDDDSGDEPPEDGASG